MLNVVLLRLASTPLMGLMHDSTISGGILSTPVDFFESIDDKILLISELDTGLKENLGVFMGKFCFIFWILGCSFRLSMWQSCLYQWPDWQRKN